MEQRIERSRTADLESYRDRVRPNQTEGTSKFLGKITTGGTLPSGGLVTYIVNPIDGIDVDESESAVPTYDVDTSMTVPVVVLGNTPAIGDVLNCFAVGGRWVAERGGGSDCGTGCSALIKVVTCFGVPAVGFTVKVFSGMTQVAQATTNSTGLATLPIPYGKTYTVTVGDGSVVLLTQSLALDCGCTTITLSILSPFVAALTPTLSFVDSCLVFADLDKNPLPFVTLTKSGTVWTATVLASPKSNACDAACDGVVVAMFTITYDPSNCSLAVSYPVCEIPPFCPCIDCSGCFGGGTLTATYAPVSTSGSTTLGATFTFGVTTQAHGLYCCTNSTATIATI